jgi:hypothetical protein
MIKSILLWLLEQTAEELHCKVGTKAPVSGIYRCGSEFISLTVGERFPPTPSANNKFWTLVVSVSTFLAGENK